VLSKGALFWSCDRSSGVVEPPTPASRGDQSPYNPLKRPCIGWRVRREARSWAAAGRRGRRRGLGLG
jgi:hypothetical protein